MTEDELQQVTVKLPKDMVEFLQAEAGRRNISPADVLANAVNTDRFLRDEELAGSNVLLEKGRAFRKVLLP
jgi:hypothetical protein